MATYRRGLHINILEVRAVRLPITALALKEANNQPAMFAINMMRCKSKALLPELQLLNDILHKKAFRIASSMNSRADALSRQQSLAELTPPPTLFQALARWRGQLQIDLMASSANNELPLFFSCLPDQQAMGYNALIQD